ncbi:uncharacterized protein MYCFIDRAFT_195091 [Pseudocercospora fijiensis CIRAD86]|uniref:Uncharacterized protein n=1 Tax=Pseudocercospora fijiensis (strain CIRAD86) TaxID=383855 RepID=M3B3D8_PSEFD|nr:uncharacterized protein MYCFIDRAFT_195091 [Pseudocercospora fijiensis CIRAD86]EME83887.1 hypothetical protein MYCFIDRAFT_195091 [Pseudocercospora fijiensis CIRAD86]
MPADAQTTVSPRATSRMLYQAIDECRGEHLTRESQEHFLNALIFKHQLQFDAKHLRRHIALRSRLKKNPSHTVNEFWRLGSDFFTEQHLRDIGYRRQTTSGTEPSTHTTNTEIDDSQGSHVTQSKSRSPPVIAGTKRGVEEALELSSDEEMEVAHRPTKAKKTDGAGSKILAAAPAPKSKKRALDQREVPSSSDQELDRDSKRRKVDADINASLRPSKPNQEAPIITGSKETATAAASASGDTQQNATKEAPTVAELAQAADAIRNGSRKPRWDDWRLDRAFQPIQDTRASFCEAQKQKLGEWDAVDTERPLFPPELPLPGDLNDRARMEIYNRVLGNIDSNMKSAWWQTMCLFVNFTENNNLEKRGPAQLVQDASPELSALYERVFATKEWFSSFTRRVNQDKAWGLEAEDVFTSMVAAAVYKDVFTAKQPWEVGDSIKDALGDKYKFLEETIKDEGHRLDILLKVCSYKVVNDKKFQETAIAEHARFLAAKLLTTLTPHLLLFRNTQKPPKPDENPHYRPDLQPRLGSVLLEMLEELYHECLVSKGKMESYWEARYEYLWPDANTVMDRKACISMNQSNDEKKIMLTYWPAVRCSKTGYDGVEEVWFASRARVRACPSLE